MKYKSCHDEVLLDMIAKIGPKWAVICDTMNDEFQNKWTPSALRNRYMRMRNGDQSMQHGTCRNVCRICGQKKKGHSCPGKQKEQVKKQVFQDTKTCVKEGVRKSTRLCRSTLHDDFTNINSDDDIDDISDDDEVKKFIECLNNAL